jgi:16S rRNA (cytosine967-C5)-methyltransferase
LTVKANAADWAERLGGAVTPTGSVRLAQGGQVTAMAGYDTGDWWVQDAAAALPARLLGDVAGKRVLDLCAAPGGKTLQLAAAGAQVVALDQNEARLSRVADNLARTRLTAELICADALDWTPTAPFDAVLVDAPCSASGTIRRHPDLPHIRGGDAIGALAAEQDKLLDRAFDWLAPAGRLVFCTCSLFPEEGEKRAAAFFRRHPTARRDPVDPAEIGGEAGFVSRSGDVRTRPDHWRDIGGLDGFFAFRATRDA